MATVKDIIEKAYTKVNGEYEAVTESSDDFKTYLNVLNQSMSAAYCTPYVKWQWLFDVDYTLPDVVAIDTFSYDIPEADEVDIANSPFDSVYFVDDDGILLESYKMTDQAIFDASTDPGICMMTAGKLHLKAISTKIIGANIKLPAYIAPKIYTVGTENVVVGSISWLVTYMAATICDASPVPFIARNADKFYKQADIFMKDMREKNRHKQHLTIKSVAHGTPITFEQLVANIGIEGIIGTGGSGVIDGGQA